MLDPKRELAFPESVVEFFEGKLGQPPGGFPPELQKRILRGRKPLTDRPGATLPPADFAKAKQGTRRRSSAAPPTDQDVISYLLYPQVFPDFAEHAGEVLGHERAADAGVLLRHGAGRGSQHRDRAGQDADHQVPDRRRPARRTAGASCSSS